MTQIPNRKGTSQVPSDPALQSWSASTFEVNCFTSAEWPLFRQRPFADFSVGEEESESHVISCSWSAPGLAQHDRCLLGILTSNGLFSLWDADGDPGFATSWQRNLVVNNHLRTFLSSQGDQSNAVAPRRLRIRAASWARDLISMKGMNVDRKIHILGLLNDDGEIVLLKVESSALEHQQVERYRVHVVCVLETQRELRSLPDGMLDELQWSDWNRDDKLCSTTLTCSTEGTTWEISVRIKPSGSSDLDLGCEIVKSYQRQVSDWNIPKSQLAMLADEYLNYRQKVLKKAWELEKGEGSLCFERCFGLATYQDYQALHVSFHPRSSLEYHIQAQETSYVIFSHSQLKRSLANADKLKFEWESLVSTSSDSALPWNFILSKVPSIHLDPASHDDCYNLCLRLLRLYLVAAFFNGWELDRASQLSESLVKNQKQMNEETLQTIEEDREEHSSYEALQRIERIMNTFLDSPIGLENCSICNEYLLWHGEGGARCEKGHQFGLFMPSWKYRSADFSDRCSLTLLAIQEPGISKFCSSCNREYLDEKKQFFQDERPEDSPFRDFLLEFFKKFSKCVYCGASVQSFI